MLAASGSLHGSSAKSTCVLLERARRKAAVAATAGIRDANLGLAGGQQGRQATTPTPIAAPVATARPTQRPGLSGNAQEARFAATRCRQSPVIGAYPSRMARGLSANTAPATGRPDVSIQARSAND